MAIQNQYQLKAVNTTAGSTVLVATGNATVHTVNFPKATTGTVYVNDGDHTIRIVYPPASIGSQILDCSFPQGLSVGAAVADSFTITYQVS